MTVKRRRAKRRDADREHLLFLFGYGNGVDRFFDGDWTFENRLLAKAAWETLRADVWRAYEHRPHGFHPPGGAVAYDGITEYMLGWRTDRHQTVPQARKQIEAAYRKDVAAVEKFRTTNAEAATTIEPEFDEWLHDLAMLRQVVQDTKPDRDFYPTYAFTMAMSDYQLQTRLRRRV